jgi:hypothetical protein
MTLSFLESGAAGAMLQVGLPNRSGRQSWLLWSWTYENPQEEEATPEGEALRRSHRPECGVNA